MLTEDQAREVIGATAYGDDGEKIGKVGQLFLDDQTGRPHGVAFDRGHEIPFGTGEGSGGARPVVRCGGPDRWSRGP